MKNRVMRAISVMLVVVLTLTAVSLNGFVGIEWLEIDLATVFAPEAKAATSGFLTYFVTNGKATIVGCDASISGSLAIPTELGGYSVTTIGADAFSGCDSLTSVTIGNSVTTIGDSAFMNCSSLTSVTIPDSVTTIGADAFSWCDSLTSITIPDSVTTIGDYAFLLCDSLTSVTIPDSVTNIGDSAFSGCDSLISVTIPDSVTNIGDYAFSHCYSLTSVTIPDSVTTIGDYAFSHCYSLTSVTIPDSVTTIGEGAFYSCDSLTNITVDANNIHYSSDKNGVLFNKNKTTLIQYPIGNARKSYTIPDSVTIIGTEAFFGCYSLTSVTIPDSVTSIGADAFSYCYSLKSVTIPDSVTTIGKYAFYSCDSLTNITVDANNIHYSSDKNGVLFNKNKTTLIQYPIGNARKSYTIPDSVTSIAAEAFSWCDSLTSIAIPDSVTTIGADAFSWCDSLTSVKIGNRVTTIGDSAFMNCSSLTSVTIPDSVTTIGADAFSGCDSLTSVTIPDSVTSIGEGAFSHCDSLTSVTIGNSVTTIGEYAFYSCDSLTSVTIQDSVTTIGNYAFYYCRRLTDVYYGGSEGQWKKISIDYGNTDLTNATIHYGKYINAQGVTVALKKTDIVLKPKSNHFSDIFTGGLMGVTLTFGNSAGTNEPGKPFFLLPDSETSYKAVLSKDGYKDYLIPAEVIASWRYVEVESGKKSTPSYEHTAVLQTDPKDNKPYVSTVFAREGDAGAYSEIRSATLNVSAGKKYNVIISAGNTGSGTCEYVIEQNANHKISNKTGVFTDVDLFNTLIYGLDCYAYVKRSDGTCSELVKINIDRQATALNENVNKFLSGSTLNLLGNDFLSYRIPSNIPLLGDAVISFGAFQFPVGIEVEGDSIQISVGADIFKYGRELKENSYDKYKKWKGEWFSDWKDLVNGVTVDAAIDKTAGEITDAKSKYDNARDHFIKRIWGKEPPAMKNKSQTFDVTGLGYMEATIIDGQIVVKEACLSVEGAFTFKYSQQGAVWVIPEYVYVEAGASIGGSVTRSRVVADLDVPVQWDWVLKINPKLKVGAGVGIKDFASLGIYANATMPIVFNLSDDNFRMDVKGEIGLEAQFCIIKAEKVLIDGTKNLINHYWGKNERMLRLPSYAVNTNVVGDVGIAQNTAQTEVVDRDYLSETSAWLGGTQTVRRVGAGARALQQDGLLLSDLQTSVFEKAEPQVVAFGDKLLMTWVEDDTTRDELNRMRLMYSIYDGSSWSQPRAVYDDGCNDTTPAIATNGTDVYFVWQKIASVITEETATIEHLVANTEIYTAVYDSASGSITDVTRRTNNNCFDYAQSVTAANGEAAYYWATCADNQMSTSMDNTICRAGSDETVAVAKQLPYVLSIAAEGEEFSYVTDTDGDLATVDDVNVFTVADGNTVAFDKQGNAVAHNAAVYGTIDNESVLFVSDGSNIYYSLNDEIITVLNTDTTVNGLQFAEVNGMEYLFGTQSDKIGNVLYAVSYVDGTWTNPVRVSNTQSLLTCIDIAVLNNTLFGVCTSTEVIFNEEDETTENGATNLCWFRINDMQDIEISDIYIDEKALTIDEENEFSVYVVNNGTQTVENLTFTIADALGNENTIEKQVRLLAGCGDFVELTYSVPENFNTTTLTVSVDSADIADGNLENNSREKQIGVPQMVLSESEILMFDDKYLVTTMLTNESDVAAENVTITIHQENADESIYIQTIEEIDARKTLFVDFVIDESDLLFDENGIAKVLMTIDDSETYKGSRLVYIFEKKEETTCAHSVTATVNQKEPTEAESGYTGDTACAGCGEVLQQGEEIPYVVYTLGDIDNDGNITSADARTALRAAVGLDVLSEAQRKAADVNKDGILNSADARSILRCAVGLETLE